MTPEQVDLVMNQTELVGSHVVAITVPTRAVRVLALEGDLVFRVEQLDPGVWKWRTLSTHAGDEVFESFGSALDEAIKMQARLKLKIQEAQRQNMQAQLAANGDGGFQ